ERVMNATSKPKAAFGTAKKAIPGVLSRANTMYLAIMAALATYVSPTVTMVAFLALIQAVEEAQKASANRGKGLAAVRNSKLDGLWSAMWSLRTSVRGLADAASHADAITLIEGAGLLVAGVGGHAIPILRAMPTTTPGLVQLKANAKALLGNKPRNRYSFFRW